MMRKSALGLVASAAVLWTTVVRAQEQAQTPAIEGGVSPVWAGAFVAMVLGLIVWFAIAVLRAESKRKAAQATAEKSA